MRVLPLLFCAATAAAEVPEALSRLAEEAEVFRQAAPAALARETLVQRTTGPGEPRTRSLVSEYSFGTIEGRAHELRQVTAVDGREVRDAAHARQMLVRGLKSPGDRARKTMLQELRRYGLEEPIADLALLILLFTKRRIPEYAFEPAGEAYLGAELAQITAYRQTGGNQNVLIVQDRRAVRQPLRGLIYSRKSDGAPLRITLASLRKQRGRVFREDAAVDYGMTPHGFVAPVSAVHRGFIDGRLRVENLFQYSGFQKFGASTEIKFTEVPEVK